nr:MAG TPA: large terminase [Caudoviricetes sp.]
MDKVTIKIAEKFRPLLTEHYRNKLYYGGRAGGKSYAFADCLLLLARQKKLFIACVREVQNSIKDSVYKLLKDRAETYKFDEYAFYEDRIENIVTGSRFVFKGLKDQNKQNIKSLEGVDICWCEEAQSITKDSFEVLNPTIRKSGSELWFSMNRENENDAIWRAIAANPDDQTLVVKVNYYDNPFCPDEMKYLAEKCKTENLDDYMHIWEGEPISLGDYKLFNVKDVREAMIPKMDSSTSPLIIGLDIARAGNDKTVFCLRKGRWVMKFEVIKGYDTVEVADKLTNYIKELHPAKAFLDLGNSGAGVYDIMKARGFSGIVRGVNFGGKAIQPDRYKNKRAEMYATANEWIKQELPVQLPNDDLLFEELTTIERVKVAGDTLQLEDKELFKKRIGRSPDRADAFVLTFAEPVYDNGTVKTYGNYTTINDLFFAKKRSNNTW